MTEAQDTAERICHRCRKTLTLTDHIGRREMCAFCGADLHVCLNCRFYDPGIYNGCREPQAERVLDKDRSNFCDYFDFRHGVDIPQSVANGQTSAKDRLAALFTK